MKNILRIASEKNTKIIFFKRDIAIIPIIQEFLKNLGIKRDWRKDVLMAEKRKGSFLDYQYYFSDNKDSSVKCSIFVGTKKVVFQVVYSPEKEALVLSLISEHFS